MKSMPYNEGIRDDRQVAIVAVLLLGLCLAPGASGAAAAPDAPEPHLKIYATNQYPSASICKQCHESVYNEWRLSAHAYSNISPVFHKFDQRINDLAQGTVGTFCVRCHASVGTTLGERRELPLWDRSQVSREGVTCITCHRINEQFAKVNGERRIVPGEIYAPVTGGDPPTELKKVIADAGKYKVRTNPSGPGLDIHTNALFFPAIKTSEFCVSCHQVAVYPGIKLEVVWDQYRSSPAKRDGITCQDCHMSKRPGLNDGFDAGPVAVIDRQAIEPTHKHSVHSFAGPGYPIAHPGLFPHNSEAAAIPIQSWLKFDYRAGWGTSDFEDKVSKGTIKVDFPKEWESDIDRGDARKIVDENLRLLQTKLELRRQVMENASRLDGPFMTESPRAGHGLSFSYKVTNLNPGHNMPSGSLGAQPEIWLDVALVDPAGKNIWESGFVDSHGDMADLHSLDVRAGKMKQDRQLFNLQTKFLTTDIKGTDREMYLPVNVDIDQLPFIRPATQPITVLNHPPFIRMEQRSIPPLGSKTAHYHVPGSLLKTPGTYKLAVRLRSRAEPLYFMAFIGSTVEMEQAMNQWMLDIHPYTVTFDVK
jgi:nitrate/TMAO reductase-like tetraheme cytochrome c subunit